MENRQKHHIMRPLQEADIKYSELRRLGYRVSPKLWRTCHNRAERNKGNHLKSYIQVK